MTAQLDLEIAPSPMPPWFYAPRDQTERRFREFHQRNEWVYEELEQRVMRWYRAGARRIGIRRAWEAMRFELDLRALERGEDSYALNDHYTACYSRVLLHRHPELRGLVEVRGHR